MKTTDVPFAVLRFQYQLARIPLQLIEAQMAAWMGSEAPPRLFYERWLGGLDTTVGNLLGDDPKLEERGGALIERSDALDRAAPLDATATQKQVRADNELKTKRDNTITSAPARKWWSICANCFHLTARSSCPNPPAPISWRDSSASPNTHAGVA